MKKLFTLLILGITSLITTAQNQALLNESWFVHRVRDSNTSNTILEVDMNTNAELRFEVIFLNDKIVIEGCCGGVFEMDVNYIGNDTLQILNLTEIQVMGCNENFVSNFYNAIKGVFNSLVGQTISYVIQNNPYEPGIKDIVFNHPANSSFVEFSNTPNEINDQAQAPYWGHEPPNHQWSLTHVTYQGQTMELPYGAALTIADIYEGTFTISLCGEIFVGINFSWELGVEVYEGPCFISCAILENTADVCDPVTGYNVNYLEDFKQHVFDFLNDNINQTMGYEFTFGMPSPNARKLIIRDFNLQNKLIFHSNPNYLSTADHNLQPEIIIYPNPVNDSLNIHSSFCDFCTVKIYSPNGKLLYNESLKTTQDKIDVKQLSSGIYFIVVENEWGTKQTEKFVKK